MMIATGFLPDFTADLLADFFGDFLDGLAAIDGAPEKEAADYRQGRFHHKAKGELSLTPNLPIPAF
jgi:hypothetical protein